MKVRKTVNLLNPLMKLVTLRPGDTVPDWAVSKITNPALLEGDHVPVPEDAPSVSKPAPVPGKKVDYAKLNKGPLQELCRERGLDDSGTRPELAARLHADDLDEIEADVWAMDESELRELAERQGIDVGEARTTAELAAAIEQATK